MKKFLFALIISVLLTACSNKLDGVYSDKMGIAEFKFQPDGTVRMMGMEFKYEVVGKEVKINSPQGALVFTIVDSETLTNEMMGTIKKKK